MARLNSFYFPTDFWPTRVGDTAMIKGTEARHMLTVLRTQEDHIVRLFDGYGQEGVFRVKEANKNRALLEAVEIIHKPGPTEGVTLAIGWGKSKRRNYLFEKTVELKGLGLAFWESARSQGRLPETPKETWHEKCVQAAKQCMNTHLPELSVIPGGVSGLIDFSKQFDACYLAWESKNVPQPLLPKHLSGCRSLIVIGPEGGLEDGEAAQLVDAGFSPVTLGDTVMRWETAATYCLSLGWLARQELK